MVCRLLLETGRGAAWLAHLLWEQRVAGSNPVAPTNRNGREVPLNRALRLFCVYRVNPVGSGRIRWRLPKWVHFWQMIWQMPEWPFSN